MSAQLCRRSSLNNRKRAHIISEFVERESPWSNRAFQSHSSLCHSYSQQVRASSGEELFDGGKGSSSLTRFVFCLTFLPHRNKTCPHADKWLTRVIQTWKSAGFSWEEAAPRQQEEDGCFQQRALVQLSEFGEVKGRVKGVPEYNHKTLCYSANKKKYAVTLYLQTTFERFCDVE